MNGIGFCTPTANVRSTLKINIKNKYLSHNNCLKSLTVALKNMTLNNVNIDIIGEINE